MATGEYASMLNTILLVEGLILLPCLYFLHFFLSLKIMRTQNLFFLNRPVRHHNDHKSEDRLEETCCGTKADAQRLSDRNPIYISVQNVCHVIQKSVVSDGLIKQFKITFMMLPRE